MVWDREKGRGGKKKFLEPGKDIFTLSTGELDTFREQVRNSGGRIRVWVHPWQSDATRVYRRGLEKILSCGRDGLPTIIFEPGGKFFDGTREMVARLQVKRGGGNVYFVPTRPANPEPVADYHMTGSAWTNGDAKAWTKLMDILSGVGVRHCLMGGLYADTSGVTDPDEGTARSCLNVTANELSRRFGVGLSNIAYPGNRARIIRSGKPWELVQDF